MFCELGGVTDTLGTPIWVLLIWLYEEFYLIIFVSTLFLLRQGLAL